MSQQPMRPMMIDPVTGLPIPVDNGIDPTMGMGTPPPAQSPGVMSQIQKVLGGPQGMMNLGASLMAGSGPSPVRQNLGSILGQSLLGNQQFQQQQGDSELKKMLLMSQIEKNKRGTTAKTPSKVQEFEYAKKNGYKGSFDEWMRIASAQQASPAGIQEYEYFSKLPKEQQTQFLALQRSPVVPQIALVNGVPTLVDRTGATPPNPLSTQESEIDAAKRKKEAEARGSAEGEAWGAMAKKGINALNTAEAVKLADPLIEVATGSATGAAADKVAAFFGTSTTGDQAIAQLRVLQANLMTNMPRMEGPQSDRDVQLYREAAGEIGDPSVPRQRKKAALKMIDSINDKYAESAPGAAPAAKKRYNPTTGKIE